MNRSDPNPFPAVLIGGPPHSGKSVLTYGLTQSLRDMQIDHYVLRACPDGEGDFSHEAHPATINLIRQKGQFSPLYVERVCQGLQNRHLPLLVDVGGKPTPEQEVIFTHCTHAILIAADIEKLAIWRQMIQRINATAGCAIEIIAELHSQLDQPDQLGSTDELFAAIIGGLERGHRIQGSVCSALVSRLAHLFHPSLEFQRKTHLAAAPCAHVVEVDRLERNLGWDQDTYRWQVDQLPQFLEQVPAHGEIALYGRGPAWLYCAVAIQAQPGPFHLFDARLSWVKPVSIALSVAPTVGPGSWQTVVTEEYTTVHWQLGEHYLAYEEMFTTTAPIVDPQKGVVLSCRGPFWLQSGLAIAYAKQQPWVAVYYPNEGTAIIVYSSSPAKSIGMSIVSPVVPASTPSSSTPRIKRA
ncbi:MAG: CRISPR-associated protein Csx3 [Caldilineaceae bacterium]